MDAKNLLVIAAISGLSLSVNASETKKSEDKKAAEVTESTVGRCAGVNTCKGTSSCHSETNSCAGTNSCKGTGWMKMTKKECDTKKGKFINKKASM
jgi:hypothetical protein